MFSLNEQSATLVHYQPRREKHGDEWMPAFTAKIEIVDSNVVLDSIDPQLRKALFRNADLIERQQPIDGMPRASETPVPRTDFIRKVPLAMKLKGTRVVFHWGASEEGNIVVPDCSLDAFELEVVKGGSAPLSFVVKARMELDQVMPLMSFWLDEDIRLSVQPSENSQIEIPGLDGGKKSDDEGGDADAGAAAFDTAGEVS